MLSQLYAVSLLCHPDINSHTKFGSFETVWEGRQCVCMCVFFLINCPSLQCIKLGDWIWFLFSTGGRWPRATFQAALRFPLLSHRPAPAIVCLTRWRWRCTSQLCSEPSARHHPVTFSSLSICVWLPYPPSMDFFFFPFSQASLVLQHMLHNFPSCCFSFPFSDIFSLFFDSLLSPTQDCHLCMSSFCHSYGLQLPSQTQLP